MLVSDIVQRLGLTCVAGKEGLGREVKGIYIGDLLSLAMANAKEGELWLTVQGHLNAIAVAVLVNIPAIILVQGIKANEEMIQKAEEEQIAILTTHKGAYDIAKDLTQYL